MRQERTMIQISLAQGLDMARATSSPHDSNLESKLDPRVDGDHDRRSGRISHMIRFLSIGTKYKWRHQKRCHGGWDRVMLVLLTKDPTATGQLPRGHDANNDQPRIHE
jgi:hypothetical protein